jgi:hypothetical protein
MNNRRGFLTALSAVSSAGLAFIMTARTRARPVGAAPAGIDSDADGEVADTATPRLATPPSAQSATPPSALPPSVPPHAPSAVALAAAATYRRFDPSLTDSEIATIAAGIDDNVKAGAVLNPARKPLRNSDEPVTRFAADEKVSA